MPMTTSRGACSTRTTATWRAAGTTSSSPPATIITDLEKLITKAEQRYTEVGSELAKHFVTQFSKAKHPISGLLRQRDIFETQVKPRLRDSKVAYVWVDALRFEMARELARLLDDDFELTVQPALATIPTITEIGMAALLPRAGVSAKVSRGHWKAGPANRPDGHQGPEGPRRVPQGPCRRSRSSMQSSTTCYPSHRRRSRTASRAPNWF